MEREREERTQREKLQRERDALTADCFQAQQQLKSLQMDYELATEKADRLDKELENVTGASKDDKEVNTCNKDTSLGDKVSMLTLTYPQVAQTFEEDCSGHL